VRRHRSKAEAERLVLEFEQSGLRRKAFCAEHGLSVATLDNYRRRGRSVERRRPQSQTASRRILPVELLNSIVPTRCSAAESRSALWVELANGRRNAVASGFDASTLERLLVVLEKA